VKSSFLLPPRLPLAVGAIGLIAAAAIGAACGSGSTSAASKSPTPAPAATNAAGGGRGFRNRTPNPAIQTSIAEGTPLGFGDRTPNPGLQTAIAEGTRPAFGLRTPSPDQQTAIAEGTPIGRGFGAGGGFGQTLTTAATVLGITEDQLRSELQAQGATLASVAAAHGQDRATFRQALIDATKKRLADAVTAGTLTQDQATQAETAFETGLDRLLDNPGAFSGPPAGAPAPSQ
jgi:hypothetical protein